VKGIRRFTVVPLLLLAVGLVAFEAGPALAVKTLELDIAIDCPPTTAAVGDTLTWTVTLSNPKSAVLDLQVTDDLSATDDPTDEPNPFNQPNSPYVTTFTYIVQASDANTTIVNSAHATGTEEDVDRALDSSSCSTTIGSAPTTATTGFNPLPWLAGGILLLAGWLAVETRRRRA
jgi:hypothetical protein